MTARSQAKRIEIHHPADSVRFVVRAQAGRMAS
ncbi:hypothetical protein JOC45_002729 [Gordonia hydrophobica]|nr:hypothetical protein [Gordonia hydrophobica]